MLSCSAVKQTTLPSWYQAAQQNIVNTANAAQTASPNFANTTAQNAVNTLQGSNNPFTQAQGTLGTIASGAANPWTTNAQGQVTPNTCTAMGGLYAAQRQQLNQLLPTTVAPCQANAVASGNFGSLRGQTAVDTAKTNAFDTLAAQQMASALQNQATGVNAASGLSSSGAQGINAALTTGTAQMNAPYTSASNYANIINAVNAPNTVTTQQQMSPLAAANTIYGTACKLACSVTGKNILCMLGVTSKGGVTGTTATTCSTTGCSSVSLNNGNGSVSTSSPISCQYCSVSTCKAGGLVGRKR
jgi:hypothetical protein